MGDDTLQHTRLDGIADFIAALDTLLGLARHRLCLFDWDFAGQGYDSAVRHETLRNFLLASPANRLFVLAHDTTHLATCCPRMMSLLHQFGTGMFVHQTPRHLQHVSEPFCVADESHSLRLFHFDDARGILCLHDPETARALQSRFLEMWPLSQPAPATARLHI